jgi:hypothetical protein
MGALPRVIAHHPEGLTLVVETAFVAALVALFGAIWLRERRRRTRKDREDNTAVMRDD